MKRDPIRTENEGLSRRHFLAASGWLALGAVAVGQPVITEAARFNKELVRVSAGRTAMGTFVNMIVFHPSKDQADEAIEKAYQEIDRLVDVLSCHDSQTPVSALNRNGVLRAVSPELGEVVSASLQFSRASDGAFDITIKPVLDLYKESFRNTGKPPAKEAVDHLASRVGVRHFRAEKGLLAFDAEGMEITLDGIGKGYIVDRAMAVLESAGIKHALINAGGDIRVIGPKGDGKPWTVAIQDPWDGRNLLDTVRMTKGAVATSGNYEVYFDREKQYHHLISPHAGSPVSGVASASIMAPTTMTADALSTAVFVLGAGRGRSFLRSTPRTKGLILTTSHQRVPVNWS